MLWCQEGRKVELVQCLHSDIVSAVGWFTRYSISGWKIRSCTRALDDFLDRIFDYVPVVVRKFYHFDAEIVGNVLDQTVAPRSANQADRYADTSKAPRTTNTMKVSLRVGSAVTVIRQILSNVVSAVTLCRPAILT